ncbi:cation transporter [Lacrimispora algidixylanolytica]|uniref:Heavy metal transporter n=1 Tax=Lacrimispora algidixylanolytica TaxID=94868 RepID=A0A419T3A0_9FIRM|nr:cation transporter [Lacrimispora algidixylanolytica]RKD31906.1 heavy metal transporter [Lacrimispora algidixylanolytica]
MKQTFILEGLDCANCAAKIERAVGSLDGVTSASVNFMTTKMTIELNDNDTEKTLQSVKKTVKKIEPDVSMKLHSR